MLAVGANVGDFVRDDQVVLGLDGGLHVIPDQPSAGAGSHGPCVRVSQRYLAGGGLLQLRLDLPQFRHVLLQGCDLFLQASGLDLGDL